MRSGFACGAALALLLAGCAAVPREESVVQREAIDANRHAARAFDAGRLDEARALYTQALKLDDSVENADGAAVNLLSLARVEQAAGRPKAAHEALDRLLSSVPEASPARKADAAARKAQLFLASGDSAQATQWSARAGEWCGQSACASLAAIQNLRALVALRAGDNESALSLSQKARDAGASRTEQANALRVSAEAYLSRRDAEAARQAAADALALDQALGLPDRVYRDLMLLGRASEQAGHGDDARAYYRRALTVANASDNAAAVREARSHIDAP